jgi:N-acetylneuraminate synthase
MKKKQKIIAEIGQAHDGSLGIAHSFIDSLKGTGISSIKFQVHIADAESSKKEKFRKKFSYKDKTRFDYWKRIEFNKNEWIGIKKHCENEGFEFIASTFSIAGINLLNSIGLKTFKIASGEVNNYLMIDKLINLKKEIILSSGLSNYDELDLIIKKINKSKIPLSVLQCTTEYPTSPKNIGLNLITEMKKRYKKNLIGFSDHSGNKNTILAATALGADLTEFHVTFDKKMFGPDSFSSIEINEVKELVDGIKFIRECINNPINKDNTINKNVRKIFFKSLAVNKNINKGEKISINDLETKKPSNMGMDTIFYKKILNKKITRNLKSGDFIKNKYFK